MADFDYDVVLVGRGYSIATYLYMADLGWAKSICIIGGPDAWEAIVRGDAGIVNHAKYLYGRSAAERKPEPQQPTTREALVNDNKHIIEEWVRLYQEVAKEVSDLRVEYLDAALVVEMNTAKIVLAEGQARYSSDGTLLWSAEKGDSIDIISIFYGLLNDQKTIKEIKALKVVYGGGAGPHTVELSESLKKTLINLKRYDQAKKQIVVPGLGVYGKPGYRIMDLDSFMRYCGYLRNSKASGKGNSVAVVGANAGIDAVIEALGLEFDLKYLLKYGGKITWLSTEHYEIKYTNGAKKSGKEAIKLVEMSIVNHIDREWEIVGEFGPKVRIKYKILADPKDKNSKVDEKNIDVDFLVYALGQDPGATEIMATKDGQGVTRIGPAKVMQPILNKTALEPIYDKNQRFGYDSQGVVLGLQLPGTTKYTGLEVIGASAVALAKGQAKEKMGELCRRLNQAPLAAADQLGVIRSQVEGITGFDMRGTVKTGNGLSYDAEEFLQSAGFLELSLGKDKEKQKLVPAWFKSDKVFWIQSAAELVQLSVEGFQGDYRKIIQKLVGSDMDKRFAACCNNVLDGMKKILALSDEVAINNTLPAIRPNVADLLGFMEIIVGEATVDFNGMDQTGLAVLFAGRYPRIDPYNWPMLEQLIIGGRRISPYGYGSAQTQDIQGFLEFLNGVPNAFYGYAFNGGTEGFCAIFIAAMYPKISAKIEPFNNSSVVLGAAKVIVDNRPVPNPYNDGQITQIKAWLEKINAAPEDKQADMLKDYPLTKGGG